MTDRRFPDDPANGILSGLLPDGQQWTVQPLLFGTTYEHPGHSLAEIEATPERWRKVPMNEVRAEELTYIAARLAALDEGGDLAPIARQLLEAAEALSPDGR